MKDQDYSIIRSDEYKEYLTALCKLSTKWVDKIRIQYASKAYEMYQNETVRKLVLAYGKEITKLERNELYYFEQAARDEDPKVSVALMRDCLNKAEAFANTIEFLFEINF